MDLKNIVQTKLIEDGFDGLYNDNGCACKVGDDFMPCDEPMPDCTAGYITKCDCAESCDFHISETNNEVKK